MKAIAMVALLAGAPAFAAEADDAMMGRRVQDLLHAHQADVFGCVAAANGTVKGEMLVRVMVGEDQRPVKADVLKDQTGLPSLGPCLQTKINKWDLTPLKATAGDQVVFPLVFKPEPLEKGHKRMLVPMSAQESQGPQRFLIDDQSVGEPPLASLSMLSLPGNAMSPAKVRKDDEEELVLYVLDGGFKVGPDALKAGDALWLGAHTDRPAITPADKQPLKLLEIRAHGEGTGQKVVHGADVKSYKVAGGKATARLLLDGTGAKLAVDELDADAGTTIATHKHQAQDEELYFLSGRSTTTVGKQTFETAAGDALRIPANAPHTMKVTEPLKAIQIYAPGGPEQRFKKEK
ncbi:MAG TPA: cupin domain-containing protein [Polyangia bacterium]|jgi:quercetin dioxygenase-like cupin family protein|nr:cupin domain-containing protein [Polyangia bacterium]